MAQIFQAPLAREFSNTGSIGAGYKYYFYTTGTTTPISTYTTPALSVANAYPVVADSTGRFPPIWISSLATTKVILKDAVDNIIYTQDPVGNSGNNTSLNDLDVRPNSYWGLTTGTSTGYVLTANPSISSYNNTQSFTFQAHIQNGAAATIAISGLSALNLKKYTGQGTKVALQVGDLQATQRYNALCDGIDIVILNPRSLPLNVGTAPTLTIATGVVTATNVGSSYILDTEGASATDDLDTINGGNDGMIINIRNVADARNVILKHNTGNIYNPRGYDITLDVATDNVVLIYSSVNSKWIVSSYNTISDFGISKLGTPVTASGTSVDFTGIPAGVSAITIGFSGVSTNGSSPIIIQIGSGSFTTSGYSSTTSAIAGTVLSNNQTGGFAATDLGAGDLISGLVNLKRLNSTLWVSSGVTARPTSTSTNTCAGFINLGGTLDRIRITTAGGANTFDAGTINIQYG